MKKVKKVISYQELVNKYLGHIVLSNQLFDYLFNESIEAGIDLEVVNGEFYEYYNQFGTEISKEQWEKCQDYNLEGDMIEGEFFQYYLIDEYTYKALKDMTDETIINFPDVGAAFWCIDHWGTPWEGVDLTIEVMEY